jgi:hypothetical protein
MNRSAIFQDSMHSSTPTTRNTYLELVQTIRQHTYIFINSTVGITANLFINEWWQGKVICRHQRRRPKSDNGQSLTNGQRQGSHLCPLMRGLLLPFLLKIPYILWLSIHSHLLGAYKIFYGKVTCRRHRKILKTGCGESLANGQTETRKWHSKWILIICVVLVRKRHFPFLLKYLDIIGHSKH